MAYTALYRKFRPTTFSEMVGQEAITKTLKNQIKAGRVGHAYLFCGGRGTGKTSSAKILARAVNCLNPKDGEPCNECEVCKGILSGSLTDVVEMDAASNNGVDDIRAIREEVNFLPTLAKYRIYIIDEVHMLTDSAFNALLKTLEEPPEHVKFILATTEPQKLPATILSRCQRFDFKQISDNDIISRLKIICKESNVEITEEALKMIAVLSEGAMRDAISILERCIQDGETKISEEKIRELVGIPQLTYIHGACEGIIESDTDKVLEVASKIMEEGKDLNNFLWEIVKYLKDVLLIKSNAKVDLYNEEEIKQIKELSEKTSKDRLLKLIYAISDLENDIKWSSQKNILFQVGLMKACRKDENEGIEELESRLNNLENIIKNGKIEVCSEKKATEKKVAKAEVETTPQKVEQKQETAKMEEPGKEKTNKLDKVIAKEEAGKGLPYWPEVINKLKETGKVTLYTNLIGTKAVEVNDMTVGIEFSNGLTSFGKAILEKPENKQEIVKLVSMKTGREMMIKYIDEKKIQPKAEAPKETGADFGGLDIPFNIIEE